MSCTHSMYVYIIFLTEQSIWIHLHHNLIGLELIDMEVCPVFTITKQCFNKYFMCVHTHFGDSVILEVCLLDQWLYLYFT